LFDDQPTPTTITDSQEIANAFLDPAKNAYMKSFESSMGRGLAGVINSLSVNYKLNELPWEIGPGMRGPTAIEVSLSLAVIHDIPPGLDANGYNRAPIYPVASSDRGDAWDATATGTGEGGFADVLLKKEYMGQIPGSGKDDEG